MNFEPFELSVKDIFSGDRTYKIPNFQRDFSWENENFDDFYNDLIESSGLTSENTSVRAENKYFFGMILLLGDKSTPSVDKPFEVIDGQQRLTTMILFFAAIQDIIKNCSQSYQTEFDDRLICKITKRGKPEQIQRLLNESLDPILPVSILNLNNLKGEGATPTPKTQEQNRLVESFEYIKKLLSKDNISLSINEKQLDIDRYIELLDGFGNHLSNSTLICIYHTDRVEVNNLFRNLNYRGKPLTQSNLIKNEIFSILEDSSNFASDTWKEIEDNVYHCRETLQRFIYHYMCGRFSGITNKNMFEKFLSNFERDKEEYIKFLDSLKISSKYYRYILEPNDNDEIFSKKNYFKAAQNPSIKRNLEFFKSIEISQYRILLITLFECRDKKIVDNTIFRNFIEQIAVHQCLHVLVSSSPNKLTSIYSKASRSLLALKSKKLTNYTAKSKEIFNKLKSELREKLPDINVVKDSMLNYSGNSSASMTLKEKKDHALIKFILQTVSEKEQSNKSNRGNDGLSFIYKATLEHIVDKEYGTENVFSLGNIVLLEGHIHQNVKGAKAKRKMYEKSNITMTQKFFADYPDFDSTKIRNREKIILELFYDLACND